MNVMTNIVFAANAITIIMGLLTFSFFSNLAYFVAFMVLVYFVAIFALSFIPKKAKERVEKKEKEIEEEQKDIL